jgi:hypothetical protein
MKRGKPRVDPTLRSASATALFESCRARPPRKAYAGVARGNWAWRPQREERRP